MTANSHKVISNLLNAVCEAADGPPVEEVRGVQKANDGDGCPDERIVQAGSNDEVAEALAGGDANLAAGTAWLWAREEMAGTVHVLVIDEAGQMSLANTLAVCQAAGSLVLLGDPRQLDQPIQGVHPPGADVSALGHLLAESATVAPSRGVFLDQTWRMHPDICAFTTEQFYQGRLRPQPELRRQTVAGPGPLAGHGLRFIPVEHAGNTNASAEEADCVAALICELLDTGASWVDREGVRKPLTLQDVLVVAPYNAHVAVLRSTLPGGARVGTVDKFQGQEAPIVIYSMATSTAEEAPRGMEFLYSLHRLNVATSRARLRGGDRRQPRSPHAGLPNPGADAPGQPLLPVPGARHARAATRGPKLTYATLSDPGPPTAARFDAPVRDGGTKMSLPTSLVRRLFAQLRSLCRGGREDAETQEELRFHLEMETEKNLRAGLDPREARRRALQFAPAPWCRRLSRWSLRRQSPWRQRSRQRTVRWRP